MAGTIVESQIFIVNITKTLWLLPWAMLTAALDFTPSWGRAT